MKTKYRISEFILLISILFLASSCSDFLNTTPSDFVLKENYFKTETDGDIAIAGVYSSLNDLYKDVFKNSFSSNTDETFFSRMNGEQLIQKTFNATTPVVYTIWSKLYLGVYRANFFLENVDSLPVTDLKKNAFRAEARFLRGYYYYHLAMLYGDVPLRLKATATANNNHMARSPRSVVFDTICADMTYAINNLNAFSAQKGAPIRVSREAATGVLARVYMSMAGVLNMPKYYSNALDLLVPLVNSKTVKLNPDYTQIWKNISADFIDNVNNEIMFDVEFNSNPYLYLYNGWAANVSPAAPITSPVSSSVDTKGIRDYLSGNQDYYKVTCTLLQYYLTDTINDVRFRWNIYNVNNVTKGRKIGKMTYAAIVGLNAGKFRRDWEPGGIKDPQKNGSNFPILRYADVLLMMSEAENEVNGPTDLAFAGLDSVRSRAKAFKYSTSTLKPTTQKDFRDIIIQERSRELCFESTTRYYDLIRWGIIIDKFNDVGSALFLNCGANGFLWANTLYVMKPYQVLLPIPQLEIQLNNLMTQNPQY